MSFKDYSNEDQNRIKDMFNFLDKEKEGKISIDDVNTGIIGLGGELTNKEINELKSKYNSFTFDDFILLCQKKKINLNEIKNKLTLAFNMLETNKKGYIPASSLIYLLKNENLDEKDIDKIINEAKPDKYKNIDYNNFIKDILEANSDDEDNNYNDKEKNDDNNISSD